MSTLSAKEYKCFEDIKRIRPDGSEYWAARELAPVLDYAKWENFYKVIKRAMIACENSGRSTLECFPEVRKTSPMPNGGVKDILDYELSRYACYLIVQNGDPRKEVIALGQTYFAIQTYVRDELTPGKYYIRELEAADGYIRDEQYKTVYVEAGKCTQIEWENSAVTGQIQITKYAAESNAITGQAGGVTLKGATFEIVRERSGKVVDYITTDARGIAASKPLPLGRYLIREVSAPAYYQVSAETFDVTLEYAGQIIKLAAYNKPAELGVTLTKTGIKEVLAGSKMSYRFTIANTSNVDLQNFYFHDKIPYDVTTVSALTTGTYNTRLTYRILYKTNYNDYRVLASNLLSTNNYSFGLSGLQLMAGEVVTDIYFDFGTVPSGFQSVTKPTLMVSVNPRTANKYYVTNRADAGGKFGETWQSANASWITIVRNLTPVRKPLLPKTGY